MKKRVFLLIILLLSSLFLFAQGISEEHYRKLLSSDIWPVYINLRTACILEESEISVEGLTASSYESVTEALMLDHPEFYYVNDFVFSPKRNTIKINYSGNRIKLSDFNCEPGDLEEIFEYFCENYVYNEKNTDQTLISALTLKKASCASLSKAFKYFANLAGYDCWTVRGRLNGEPHMWNQLCLDNKIFNIDIAYSLTSDDKFFLVPDTELGQHTY